jgi:hypothetical protein
MMEGEVKRNPHNNDSNKKDETDDIDDVPHRAEILCHTSPLYLLSLDQDPAENKRPQDVLLNCNVRLGVGVAQPEYNNEEEARRGGMYHETVHWDVYHLDHSCNVCLKEFFMIKCPLHQSETLV